ncbi:hypothetical protein TARUN_5024 [Trichoderma arundinaceum]|uniref:Uncharacterized protein n=1 Tax=Trichoderma arundinaceum TaxID=490622 RepID=A0A395NMY1_TRIAR|nr:hypothetical protein TARUN_5024 [Trichoderma arundinaceum]
MRNLGRAKRLILFVEDGLCSAAAGRQGPNLAQQRECFEALAAQRRSLFSADNKAARWTDGVPDSPKGRRWPRSTWQGRRHGTYSGHVSVLGTVWRAPGPPPAALSVARSKEPEAICFAVSGARNRRELAPGGQRGIQLRFAAVVAGNTGLADEDDWPEASHVADPGQGRSAISRMLWSGSGSRGRMRADEGGDTADVRMPLALPIRAGQDSEHHPLPGCRLKSAQE